MVEAFNHHRGRDGGEDEERAWAHGEQNKQTKNRSSDFSFFLFLLVWMSAFFHFLYFALLLPLSFSLSVVSGMSCSERVRGVWVCGVSPSNNRYRSRDGSREMEVENRETKEEMDMEREDGKTKRTGDMMVVLLLFGGGGGVCVCGGGSVAAGI